MKKFWNEWIQPNKTQISLGVLILLTVFRIPQHAFGWCGRSWQ
mgnify:CR=1 FL=1